MQRAETEGLVWRKGEEFVLQRNQEVAKTGGLHTNQKGREGGKSYSMQDGMVQRSLELWSKGLVAIQQSLVLPWKRGFLSSHHQFLSS